MLLHDFVLKSSTNLTKPDAVGAFVSTLSFHSLLKCSAVRPFGFHLGGTHILTGSLLHRHSPVEIEPNEMQNPPTSLFNTK